LLLFVFGSNVEEKKANIVQMKTFKQLLTETQGLKLGGGTGIQLNQMT
jgi:hypothetical protein